MADEQKEFEELVSIVDKGLRYVQNVRAANIVSFAAVSSVCPASFVR